MIIRETAPLFAWEALQDSPTLATVRDFLHAAPDGRLLESLRRARGRGRNDYPVSVLWGVCLLQPLLRHVTIEATLGELRRNAGLRRLIGIEHEHGVPRKWNVSRFQKTLGQSPHRELLHEAFDAMVRRLADAVGAAFAGRRRRRRTGSAHRRAQGVHRRRRARDQGGGVVRLQAAPGGGRRARGSAGLAHHAGGRR